MKKVLRPLLLIAALLFSQHAAMLHGLAHAEHELALASKHGDTAPALDHGADVCVVFGALAQALGNADPAQFGSCVQAVAKHAAFEILPAVTRVVFDSRAPPLSA